MLAVCDKGVGERVVVMVSALLCGWRRADPAASDTDDRRLGGPVGAWRSNAGARLVSVRFRNLAVRTAVIINLR
jgi:hypothetical protein